MQDLPEIISTVILRAKRSGISLPDPVEIEYGFGWSPTTTVWIDNRRVHWYDSVFEIQFDKKELSLIVEVAEVGENRHVIRGITQSTEILFSVIELFLHQRVSFQSLKETLPELQWRFDQYDHDKFIPYPPTENTPGNIKSLFS